MIILRQREFNFGSNNAVKLAKVTRNQIASSLSIGKSGGILSPDIRSGLNSYKRNKGRTIVTGSNHIIRPVEHPIKLSKKPINDPNQLKLNLKYDTWKRQSPVQKTINTRKPSHSFDEVITSDGLERVNPIYSNGTFKIGSLQGLLPLK